MIPSLALAVALLSTPAIPVADQVPRSPSRANIGPVVTGVVVADVAVAADMATSMALMLQDAGGRAALRTLRSGGAVPFVAGASLVVVGASGVGAVVGDLVEGGTGAEVTPVVVGAMAGALVGALAACPPGLVFLSDADRLARQRADSLGNAIGTGLAGGLSESFGLLWVAATPLLVAPVAGGAAFAAASLAGFE